MKPHKYTSSGIVLGRRNIGEADRILSIFTLEYGRVAFLAKGIRRPKSRKRGHLEIFSYMKFEAVKSAGLDLLTEADSVEDFNEIRHSLAKTALAYYFMEIIGKITHEGERNDDLFHLLLQSLYKLRDGTGLKKQKKFFVERLLTLLGFWPEGRQMDDTDRELENVIERQIVSARVGKRILE